jgi:hypothetical protein
MPMTERDVLLELALSIPERKIYEALSTALSQHHGTKVLPIMSRKKLIEISGVDNAKASVYLQRLIRKGLVVRPEIGCYAARYHY